MNYDTSEAADARAWRRMVASAHSDDLAAACRLLNALETLACTSSHAAAMVDAHGGADAVTMLRQRLNLRRLGIEGAADAMAHRDASDVEAPAVCGVTGGAS